MRKITEIIVHCSATPPEMDIGVAEIRKWHTDPPAEGGNGWSDIGYHYVIRRSGSVQRGRPLERVGAHAKEGGHNQNSIGVCFVGGVDKGGKPDCNYTQWQWRSVEILIEDLLLRFPEAKVLGHRDVSSKSCPCFDVAAWWYGPKTLIP